MKNIIVLLCFLSLTAFGQGLKTQGKMIVNSKGEEVLLRGMGPGGWQIMEGYMMQSSGVAGSQHEIKEKLIELMGKEKTEIFFEKWRENHFTKRDVDSLAAWGFNSIRVPMHYNLFTLPIEDEPVTGENTWIETGFSLIDSLLKWSKPHEIYIILDMHATPGGQGTGSEINDYDPDKPSLWESQLNRDKTVALWTRIADRYKDEEWIGGYDLINETHWDLPGGTLLRTLYGQITEGIRSVDTNHIIFIEGNWYANDFTGLTPPWDTNMVYSFHKYWSFNDEVQPSALAIREDYNVPLWMGESGENSNTWFTEAISLFENNNIGWAWWTIRKVGDIDSPYAVDINPGYQRILDYWGGNGSKPTEQEAFDGMMQLAENLLVENSRYRKDVPDALFRQVATDETKPYTHHTIPGTINLSDYDLGKNHFAYYDKDVADYNLSTGSFIPWNSGWSYRNDGVDIEVNRDLTNTNGFHVGFTSKGEWISYTVEVEEAGIFSAEIYYATDLANGRLHLSLDDQSVTSSKLLGQTGGWTSFQTAQMGEMFLPEGEHVLKVHFDNGSVNVSNVVFTKSTTTSLAFAALTATTGDDEQSVELTFNSPLMESSLANAEELFTVKMNGFAQEVTDIRVIEGANQSIKISLAQPIFYRDILSVGYDASEVKAASNQTLNAFSQLLVTNLLPERKILPGRIEAEDYDNQEGLGLEETTDVGEGQNIGYTDNRDYADYKVFVREGGDFEIRIRIAAQDREGSVGFYLVDEDGKEDELVTMTTPQTGGWQTWETISDLINIPEGIHTLRMKVLGSGFNMNWFETESIALKLQPQREEKFKIYPNPVSDRLFIGDEHADQYVILTLNGREIMTGIIPESRSLTLSHLKEGFYIVNLLNLETGKITGHHLLITK